MAARTSPIRTARVQDRRRRPAPAARPPGLAASPQLEAIRQTLTEGPVQRSAAPAAAAFGLPGRTAGGATAPARPAPEAANRTGLPDRLKTGVEALSGLAMDDVRVHRGSPEPARLGALAYTQGSAIHLGPGQEQHLPHEAWHVVQQKQGRVRATAQMKGAALNEDARLEAEADRMGKRALTHDALSGGAELAATPRSPARAGPPASAPVQRRRVPSAETLDKTLPPGDSSADVAGMARVLSRAWENLRFVTDVKGNIKTVGGRPEEQDFGRAKQDEVRAKLRVLGLEWDDQSDLLSKLTPSADPSADTPKFSRRAAVIALAKAITEAVPAFTLDKVNEFHVRAAYRADRDKITTLLKKANAVFVAIENGDRDNDIIQVFGKNKIEEVKSAFSKGQERLTKIIEKHLKLQVRPVGSKEGEHGEKDEIGIYTDLSGYSEETYQGGLSTSNQIMLDQEVFKTPDSPESIIMIIHEAMHAGNYGKITDEGGYVYSKSITNLSTDAKLGNAACFEIIARRHFRAKYSYEGEIFKPVEHEKNDDGQSKPKVESADPATAQLEALPAASESFRKARHASMELHKHYLLPLFRRPWDWTRAHAKALPYWSKVEMLTMHERVTEGRRIKKQGNLYHAVTMVDLALSEGLTRKLFFGSQGVPQDLASLQELGRDVAEEQYEKSNTELKNVAAWHNLIVEWVISRHCGEMTGPPERDRKVVNELARIENPEMFLTPADPKTFD